MNWKKLKNKDIILAYLVGILSFIGTRVCTQGYSGLEALGCIAYITPLIFISLPLLVYATIRTFRNNLKRNRLIFTIIPLVLLFIDREGLDFSGSYSFLLIIGLIVLGLFHLEKTKLFKKYLW